MAAESHSAEVCHIFDLLIRAMVDSPNDVSVSARQGAGSSTVIDVKVSNNDMGKLIGQGGRTSRSLRIILATVSKAQREQYQLDINGKPVELPRG